MKFMFGVESIKVSFGVSPYIIYRLGLGPLLVYII